MYCWAPGFCVRLFRFETRCLRCPSSQDLFFSPFQGASPQAALNKQRAKNKRKNMCLIEINRISELKTCMFNHVCHVFSDRLARCRGRLFDHLLRGELHRPHGEPGGGHSAFAAVRDGLPNGEGSEARWKGSTAWGLRSSCDTCGLVHGWTGLHGVSVTGHGVVGGFCKHNQTASR